MRLSVAFQVPGSDDAQRAIFCYQLFSSTFSDIQTSACFFFPPHHCSAVDLTHALGSNLGGCSILFSIVKQLSILQTQNHECDFCIRRVVDAGEMLRSGQGRVGQGRGALNTRGLDALAPVPALQPRTPDWGSLVLCDRVAQISSKPPGRWLP